MPENEPTPEPIVEPKAEPKAEADPLDFVPPEETPSDPPASPAGNPDTVPALPAALLSEATNAGFTAEEIADFDEKSLKRALSVAERFKPKAEPPKAEVPKDEPEKPWDLPWEEPVGKEYAPDDEDEAKSIPGEIVHPGVRKVVNLLHAHYKERLAKLEQMEGAVRQLWQDMQHRHTREGFDRLDKLFGEVAETYPEFKAKPSELADGTDDYQRYQMVVNQIMLRREQAEKAGKKLSDAQARDEVLHLLYGKREKKSAPAPERPRDPETGKFTPTPTARPTQRNGVAPKGKDREAQAIAELDEKLRGMGMEESELHKELKESLLS